MSDVPAVSTVKVTEHGLRIDRGYELRDLDVRTAATAAIGRAEALDVWMTRMIKIGVAATHTAATHNDLDRLERALLGLDKRVGRVVDDAVGKLSEHVTRSIDPEANGLAAVSRDSMQRLNDGVSRLVSGTDSALATNLRNLVAQVFNDAQATITQIVTSQAATTQRVLQQDRDAVRESLLAAAERQHVELRTVLTDLRQSIAVSDTARKSRAKSSQRGDDYEGSCLELIQAVAARSGDAGGVEHTARTAGGDGNFVGDITVQLTGFGPAGGPTATLAIEAKDRRDSNRLSLAALTKEARRARSNRSAAVSMILVPPQAMPVADQLVVVLEDNSLVLCWEPGDDDTTVTAAYLLLKMLALSGTAESADNEANLVEARKQLDAARNAVSKIDDITREAGKAERSLTLLKGHAAELKTELLRRLLELAQALNVVAPEQPPGPPATQVA